MFHVKHFVKTGLDMDGLFTDAPSAPYFIGLFAGIPARRGYFSGVGLVFDMIASVRLDPDG